MPESNVNWRLNRQNLLRELLLKLLIPGPCHRLVIHAKQRSWNPLNQKIGNETFVGTLTASRMAESLTRAAGLEARATAGGSTVQTIEGTIDGVGAAAGAAATALFGTALFGTAGVEEAARATTMTRQTGSRHSWLASAGGWAFRMPHVRAMGSTERCRRSGSGRGARSVTRGSVLGRRGRGRGRARVTGIEV